MNLPSASLLLVEDSDEDYETALRAFKRVQLNLEFIRCENAREAMDYLFTLFAFFEGGLLTASSHPRFPSLILLDLNLPGTDGRTLLYQIKREKAFQSIPVVILTTSSDQRDVDQCYLAGANGYLKKP